MNRKTVAALSFLATTLVAASAFAQEGAKVYSGADATLGMAAALCMSLAAFGGALGQGKAAAAALDGIARNPGAAGKLQTPLILSLALIESLVIYALIIAFLIQGKF